MKLILYIGVISIIISGIFIGAWTDDQRQRDNFQTETETDKIFKTQIGLISGLIGIISLGVAGLIYFLQIHF